MIPRYTLVGDGSSDRILCYPIDWILQQIERPFESQVAILPPGGNVRERVEIALRDYPCEMLIIHRDAESESLDSRRAEIERLCGSLEVPQVCLVPVRMTEAWFLFDSAAIRRAAGNPNGKVRLELPSIDRVEKLVDPKESLYQALRTASGLGGYRLKKFRPNQLVHRVGQIISDFSPLERLPAFRTFQADLRRVTESLKL